MKSIHSFLLFFTVVITSASNAEVTSFAKQVTPNVSLCDKKFEFLTQVKSKSQSIKVSEKISIAMKQALATQRKLGSEIATNIICQRLIGASYTGSEEEWGQFITNAVNGMKKSGGKKMRLELIGKEEDKKIYQGLMNHKEYKFSGEFAGHKQVIFNLALLDKQKNTVYTISVSGAKKIEEEVVSEFSRIISSLAREAKR